MNQTLKRLQYIYETIRQDNLSGLLSQRYETVDKCLGIEDTPEILMDLPTTLMISAFYGSVRCFKFLSNRISIYERDVYFLFSKFIFII